MARFKALLLAAVTVALLAFSAAVVNNFTEKQQPEGYALVTLHPEKGKPLAIKAEIADTEDEMRKGLMFRESLGKNEGMLFVYPSAAVINFWMKNTLIPLDMIFIAENMTIMKIHRATPCTSEPCQLYNSGKPAKYVLEVNANLTSADGVQEGSAAKVSLPTRLLK